MTTSTSTPAHPPSPALSFTESIPETKPSLSVSQVHERQTETSTQTETKDYDPSIGAHPSSPFYRHATPSSKLAHLTSQRKRSCTMTIGTCSPIDDLEGQRLPFKRLYDDEARNTNTTTDETTGLTTNANANIRELKLWAQKKRYCDCLAGLSKRQRLWVKIAMAVVIVGSMVAVALGITAAVGGGVWSGHNQSEKLP
ncbi:uncharacterized protein BDV17DRAFT_295971 [Aspergillus undulatus]|uniref:uncharacterized protein n=1 Tax=Aspergillus undulatus TaxID=1810928 RepID=UPI003CCD8494